MICFMCMLKYDESYVFQCRDEPRSQIVFVAKPKRIYTQFLLYKNNMLINKQFMLNRTDFTIGSIGEHGSPLQQNNHIATFIKYILTYNLCRYLRASNERPYRFATFIKLYLSNVFCHYLWQIITSRLNFSIFNFKKFPLKIRVQLFTAEPFCS